MRGAVAGLHRGDRQRAGPGRRAAALHPGRAVAAAGHLAGGRSVRTGRPGPAPAGLDGNRPPCLGLPVLHRPGAGRTRVRRPPDPGARLVQLRRPGSIHPAVRGKHGGPGGGCGLRRCARRQHAAGRLDLPRQPRPRAPGRQRRPAARAAARGFAVVHRPAQRVAARRLRGRAGGGDGRCDPPGDSGARTRRNRQPAPPPATTGVERDALTRYHRAVPLRGRATGRGAAAGNRAGGRRSTGGGARSLRQRQHRGERAAGAAGGQLHRRLRAVAGALRIQPRIAAHAAGPGRRHRPPAPVPDAALRSAAADCADAARPGQQPGSLGQPGQRDPGR